MSKVDELRALREARHAQDNPSKRRTPPPVATGGGVCGHVGVGGRACIKPPHDKGNHKYPKVSA